MDAKLKERINDSMSLFKEGWCWPEKAEGMANLIVDIRPELVVEIGVFGGRSLVPQALAIQLNKTGLIAGIDSWRAEHSIEGGLNGANDDWWRSLDLDKIHNDFIANLWKCDLQKYCSIIRSGSDVAVNLFHDRSVDVLHIDGNHSEEISCRDVDQWLPKVRKGGFIWMDDANWPSLQKAVSMLDQKCSTILDIAAPERLCRLYRLDKSVRRT